MLPTTTLPTTMPAAVTQVHGQHGYHEDDHDPVILDETCHGLLLAILRPRDWGGAPILLPRCNSNLAPQREGHGVNL